jgi:hypothetical protein
MNATGLAAHGRQQRRLRRVLTTTALAAALCLATTACGDDLLGGELVGRPSNVEFDQAAKPKPTEKSVRAFYARASRAYRTGNARQLCRMTLPDYAKAMVNRAAAGGVAVSSCPELWRFAISSDPQGHREKVSKIVVKGKTATLLSGNDPWRLRWVHGKWLIVRS